MNNLNKNLKHTYQYIGFLPSSVRIKENGYWGINNFEGNEILPSNYIELFTLSSGYGLIAARDAGFWDIYDHEGNKLNSQRFAELYPYYGLFGMTKVRVGNKWGMIDKFGGIVVPISYMKIEKFGRGMIFHKTNKDLEFVERIDLLKLGRPKVTKSSKNEKKSLHKNVFKFPQRKSKIK